MHSFKECYFKSFMFSICIKESREASEDKMRKWKNTTSERKKNSRKIWQIKQRGESVKNKKSETPPKWDSVSWEEHRFERRVTLCSSVGPFDSAGGRILLWREEAHTSEHTNHDKGLLRRTYVCSHNPIHTSTREINHNSSKKQVFSCKDSSLLNQQMCPTMHHEGFYCLALLTFFSPKALVLFSTRQACLLLVIIHTIYQNKTAHSLLYVFAGSQKFHLFEICEKIEC